MPRLAPWRRHGRALFALSGLLAMASLLPDMAQAQAQCMLCTSPRAAPAQSAPGQVKKGEQAPAIPISIEISTALDFSRATILRSGRGNIRVDPSGSKILSGDLTDLGGMALVGQVVVRGEPGRAVRVDMPAQVNLSAPGGGTSHIRDLTTNLPPLPRLDPAGELRFSFGGTFTVTGGHTGLFRGRIPISVDYE